jgi:hypothetical protein
MDSRFGSKFKKSCRPEKTRIALPVVVNGFEGASAPFSRPHAEAVSAMKMIEVVPARVYLNQGSEKAKLVSE